MQRNHGRHRTGKLYVVGTGSGHPNDRTRRAEKAIHASRVVVGYTTYLQSIRDLTRGKKVIASGMRQEVSRCQEALEEAQKGQVVALISSGDSGIYGMAGLALEMAAARKIKVPIEIVPGLTAAVSAAARLGAPLMLDFACISLSDLLVPWKTIQKRLEAVAASDLVVALYNPRSKTRVRQLERAAAIFCKHRPGVTPVGIATAVGSTREQIILTDLKRFLKEEINMRSVVLIGNRSSRVLQGWFVTPRGYKVQNPK